MSFADSQDSTGGADSPAPTYTGEANPVETGDATTGATQADSGDDWIPTVTYAPASEPTDPPSDSGSDATDAAEPTKATPPATATEADPTPAKTTEADNTATETVETTDAAATTDAATATTDAAASDWTDAATDVATSEVAASTSKAGVSRTWSTYQVSGTAMSTKVAVSAKPTMVVPPIAVDNATSVLTSSSMSFVLVNGTLMSQSASATSATNLTGAMTAASGLPSGMSGSTTSVASAPTGAINPSPAPNNAGKTAVAIPLALIAAGLALL